jgi:hypothetical protein
LDRTSSKWHMPESTIDKDVLFEKLGYKPHSKGQWSFHNSKARFRVPCCGRRWGKSQAAGHEMTAAMFVPESINWIVGPKYVLGEKEFRVVWNDFKRLGLISRCKTHYNIEQGRMDIFFPDVGSQLQVKSAERPDSLVGEGVDHICISEAAKHRRTTWEMYLRPALQDKRGTADFPSTPQGFNWYKGLYDLGEAPEHKDYECWRFPSWTNPVVFPGGFDDPEIQASKTQMSEMLFNQEIAAEFTSFEGQIYPEFNPDIHVKTFSYNPRYKNWLALDFGYVDPFVCLDIMIDPSDRVWVWREYMVSYIATNEHGVLLKNRENPENYHIDAVAADPRGADEIATLTWHLGTILCNAIGWALGVEEIKKALKVREDGFPGLIIHPRCQTLIKQMRALRANQPREDRNARPGQHDYDDHGPDALRYFFGEYFVMGANQSLRDVYDVPMRGSEAESFFKYESGLSTKTVF